ncbi:ABC transporter ATP-binding protein [Corynebacterium guangdongense]|uniref:Nitrate/nitrite transport system ATP-binding protein n=1 Tax=Corynebacterium guangdongense TaxID=1783348 RepID=A0ABU2A0F2_9CORY|nr:ABC transporter ATP-binding protein [Corynebacterium guangdongense]MDR7330661.1 nitrate/nitrite transport system ATP-binding protein [Corynebacterium guangdongense]WJZ16677.1 Bicarbonate transport ATP-binding protein CmpD [Corynebacterium guangdongense]
MTNNHIEIDAITKSYGATTIIGETSVAIREGQFVSLLGPSGSGKSTILNMIAGLDFPSTGTVTTAGTEVTGPGPDRGMVFQNHALLPWMTARGNVDFGLRSARPSLSRQERATLTDEYLDKVGLAHAADRRPARLSGGMQQRVGLARAFAIDSDILLLDEPFGALDALTRRQLQSLLLEVWEANRRTVVMVTHDVDEAVLLSDRVLVMSPGPEATIIEDLTVDLARPRFGTEDASAEDRKDELRHHLLGLLEH